MPIAKYTKKAWRNDIAISTYSHMVIIMNKSYLFKCNDANMHKVILLFL